MKIHEIFSSYFNRATPPPTPPLQPAANPFYDPYGYGQNHPQESFLKSFFSLVLALVLSAGVLFGFLTLVSVSSDGTSRIEIESVSVCLSNNSADSSHMKAQWRIGFSAYNWNGGKLYYENMNFSIQCMTTSPTTGTVLIPSGLCQDGWGSSSYTSFDMRMINSSLPFFNAANTVLEFDINFQGNLKYRSLVRSRDVFLNSTCRGMKVGFGNDIGRCGTMLGGPMVCLDHKFYKFLRRKYSDHFD